MHNLGRFLQYLINQLAIPGPLPSQATFLASRNRNGADMLTLFLAFTVDSQTVYICKDMFWTQITKSQSSHGLRVH